MSTTEVTVNEMIDSLTGYDEIAIAKAFDAEWTVLAEAKPITFARALVFVDRRRGGLDDKKAKVAALEMTVGQVNSYFAEDDEPMPEDPVTPAGKDDTPPAALPASSPPSAS